MTNQELIKHQKWCKQKWNGIGEDVFQEAVMIAMKRYVTIEKVNQNLFSKICREAARELKKHERYEIPFSCLSIENSDQADEIDFDPEDSAWQKEYDAIENMEEVEKLYGKWLLNALLTATAKPSKCSKVTAPHKNIQMELFTVA